MRAALAVMLFDAFVVLAAAAAGLVFVYWIWSDDSPLANDDSGEVLGGLMLMLVTPAALAASVAAGALGVVLSVAAVRRYRRREGSLLGAGVALGMGLAAFMSVAGAGGWGGLARTVVGVLHVCAAIVLFQRRPIRRPPPPGTN